MHRILFILTIILFQSCSTKAKKSEVQSEYFRKMSEKKVLILREGKTEKQKAQRNLIVKAISEKEDIELTPRASISPVLVQHCEVASNYGIPNYDVFFQPLVCSFKPACLDRMSILNSYTDQAGISVNITCDYLCTATNHDESASGECDCTLEEGQDSSCPQ